MDGFDLFADLPMAFLLNKKRKEEKEEQRKREEGLERKREIDIHK